MASWILTINKGYPQHWQIAKENGFWDMTSMKSIESGDVVYFWQATASLLGQTRVTSDSRELTPADPLPWDDKGERQYVSRFTFDLISDEPRSQPKWNDMRRPLSAPTLSLQAPRRFDDQEDEAVLASYFGQRELTAEETLDDEKRAEILAGLSEDLRKRTLQMVALRHGQPAFRRSLLTAYSGTCAVTGTATERVLEAAHIAPYKGEHTNRSSNGLLLRADIHTLFDLHLVTITPDHVVHVAAEVVEYAQYDGRRLFSLPEIPMDLPDAEQLAIHNSECDWLMPQSS